MSSFGVIVLLLLTFASVEQVIAYNIGVITMPLFQMLVKNLPQNEAETSDEYTGLTEYYNKLKVIDAWKANPDLSLETILNDKVTTVITDGRTLYERNQINADALPGYNCTRWCYNVSVSLILNITGWSVEKLEGKISPIVKLRDIHNAMVKAIEKRFCCNMTAIAIRLNLTNGVETSASDIHVWEMFVPRINEAAIQCKADYLKVTRAELAELLRTDLATLNGYDLNQMESNFFPAYEDLLRRKNLFETLSVITGVLVTAPQTPWESQTMSQFASILSQLTVRDLEILYRWHEPQLFAIQNIPMSIFQSGCGSLALADPLLKLSEELFGFHSNLPSCDIAYLLSRSLNEVDTKYNLISINDQNVLNIFRDVSKKYSWFDFYQLLQLNIDQGIWIETPRISQVAIYSNQTLSQVKGSSIPQVVSYIQNFNKSLILNTIMRVNYASFLGKLLSTYGYSPAGLAMAAEITESQLNLSTIQEAHGLILRSVMERYNISHLVSTVGISGVDFYVSTNLPSFEWDRIVRTAIQAAFNQSADAYSAQLSRGGVLITTVSGGLTSIQVSDSTIYHTNKTTPSKLADCLNKSLSSIYSLTFIEYHHLFDGNIIPTLQNKFKFETQTLEAILLSMGLQFDDIKNKSVAEVITQLTSLTIGNIGCFYPWNSTFLSTDLAKTFENANTTRLCNEFLGHSLYDIVVKIGETADKVCFLCTLGPCADNAVCRDVPDSFTCTCNKGYTGVATSNCTDIPECLLGLDSCHVNATCMDTSGSYECTCKPGFVGNGEVCSDINECTVHPDRCGTNGICINTVGNFYCDCVAGYRWNGSTCVDIDECITNTDNCHANASCTNSIGSFSCACNTGLTGNGTQCEDIRECNFQANSYPCHVRANCIELYGSYRCECINGYTGDGKNCVDINECTNKTDNCDTNAQCTNTIPGFICQCDSGFTGNGVTCGDINECLDGSHNCHKDANCVNNVGSFTCDCKDGFNGNGTYCYVAQVSFMQTEYSVTEGGQVVITISLAGAVDSPAVVNVNLGGTATVNEDYTINGQAVLFTVNGSTSQSLTIDTNDDTKLEKTETITLDLSPISNHVAAGVISTTTVIITDNDAVTVAFSRSLYSVKENDGFANIVVRIASGTIEREIVVSVTTVASSATENVDYTPSSEEVRFAPGNTAAKIVKIPIINDTLTENKEEFSANLSTTDTDVNLLNKTATIVVEDDDIASVKFEKSTYSVGEGNGYITVKLLMSGTLAVPVTARLTTSNGTAEFLKDYQYLLHHDITFLPNGTTSSSVNISITNDEILENDENFLVTLSSRTLPSLVVNNPQTTLITILDDDVLSVSFDPATYSVEEGNTTEKVKVVVTGAFEKQLHLSVSTVDDTAKSGLGDYQAVVGLPVIFNVGDSNQKEVSVQVLEDVVVEDTESFYVDMTSSDAKIVFTNGTRARIDIQDDDRASAFIPSAQYRFQESATSTIIPVILTGSLAVPVIVRLSTVHDTALWPSDFAAVSNFEIEFKPGEPQTKQLQLNIKNDTVVEETERFYVVLTNADNHVSIGNWNRTTILIEDDDDLHVRFSSSQYTADEESHFVTVGLVLQEFLETSVRVRLTPSNGTATAPEDFPLRKYDVTLDSGPPRTFYVRINVTNDMLEEYSEHFLVSLSPLDSNVKIMQPNATNITIAESDDIYFCDPNARKYPCHIKADCVDVPSSYDCTCVAGYQGDGLSCQDINECNTINCPFNATCQNTDGSYRCICQTGYRGDGVDCRDIDECADGSDNCDTQATCTNILGSFVCQCKNGFEGSGTTCTDIDECARNLDNCHGNATCQNAAAGFECTCLPGFRGSGEQCEDIDECIEQTHNCNQHATCRNTNGSFTCTCNSGFTGNGINCTDINECTIPSHDCHANASCSNTPPGSFSCNCGSGFEGNGRNCTDIDECARSLDNCPANSICINEVGSFFCQCSPGYVHNGSVCSDINECNGNHGCHSGANCVNEPGSFRCVCKSGFTGNETTCTDLDECTLNPRSCHQYANCSNTQGSFTCTCHVGYSGNGTYCEDIIDCIEEPRKYPCDVRATCEDVPGGFTCTCPSGFTRMSDKTNCLDINECLGSHGCHPNASCVNNPGSYECKCKPNFVGDGKSNCVDTTCTSGNPCSANASCSVNVAANTFKCVCLDGFTGDGYVCTDIDECLIPGSCGPNTNCINQPKGSHTCSCKPGFTGDPNVNCSDINECLSEQPCDGQATCENNEGSYSCTCKEGYSGDGVTCQDINECLDGATCDSNANCTNEPGGHRCTCRSGFTGDGKTCMDINECSQPSICPANYDCQNLNGSYSCSCKPGFYPDNDKCSDINECELNVCDVDALCKNTLGSFQCVCPENLYRNGNFCHVFCPFKLDLAFIVDTSQSISMDNFRKVRNFMTDSVAKMEIGENGNHIAAISFGDTAEVFMDFNTITGARLTRTAIINSLSNFTKRGGLTRIDLALLKADTDVFTEANGMRVSGEIRKIAVVITDGKQTTGPGLPFKLLEDSAKKLQAKDVTVLAIGIGPDVPRYQLLNFTNGIEEYILEVNSFDDLTSITFQFLNTTCTDINECKLYNPCNVNAVCKDTLGAYTCLCKMGYSGDGFECEDINECQSGHQCNQSAKCNNTNGSYSCTCNLGFFGNGRECQEVNECNGTNNCHSNASCIDELGTYRCVCQRGFTGNGTICDDVDECIGDNNCHSNASCINEQGTYRCVCQKGFMGNGSICVDINECNGNNSCHSNANCTNEKGTYRCVCQIGFTGNGTSCYDINECLSNHQCHQNATCNNTYGSHTCTCNPGFTGDGKRCQVLGRCPVNCHSNAYCSNAGNSSSCICNRGFTGNGTNCTDKNECLSDHQCHRNATCNNTDGSYTCTCNAGFTGDGKQCQDINECLSDHQCNESAGCSNTNGSYICTCNNGFTGDGRQCEDINECQSGRECSPNATCDNIRGSYTCTCNANFTGNGTQCLDLNRCPNCPVNAQCAISRDTLACVCNIGFSGDGFNCTDINECLLGRPCNQSARCDNTNGSYTCTCNNGFSGDGRQCEDINECNGSNNNCHSNADCINVQGTYRCVCKNGFTGNGSTCADDIDECLQGTPQCGAYQTCRNYPGAYECFCSSPRKYLQNGSCIDVTTINVQMTILNELYSEALSTQNSLLFYSFTRRLIDNINAFFEEIYQANYVGSMILNLSKGSVVVDYLIHFTPDFKPSISTVQNDFNERLQLVNGSKMMGPYVIADSPSANLFKDYDECNPSPTVHIKDCPVHSYCRNTFGSYDCICLSGYEKDPVHDICIEKDDDWWIIYAAVFSAMLLVVLFLNCVFCCLEVTQNKERYTLHEEERNDGKLKYDKRIDEELAPGFPGSVPRTSSTGSQLLLRTDRKSPNSSEKLAMYEVNPIYDSVNDKE